MENQEVPIRIKIMEFVLENGCCIYCAFRFAKIESVRRQK